MPIDTSGIKAPTRRATAPKSTSANASIAQIQSPNEKRTLGLMGLGQLGQAVLLSTKQYADAAAIGSHWGPIAKELANIADANEAFAKPIDFLIEIGPYGALVQAVLPLALQLAANHKLIPAESMLGQGVVPPEVLESQMMAQVLRMQSEAKREQQMALREARDAQAEFERMMAEDDTHGSTANSFQTVNTGP